MGRRTGKLNQKFSHLFSDRIGDVLGLGNIQVLVAGTQNLDVETDLVLFTLSSPTTLVLPAIDSAILNYPYRLHNIGNISLTVTTADNRTLDRRTTVDTAMMPPTSNITIAAIEEEDGTREWVILDFSFTTQSFPRLVSGAVQNTATVNLELGLVTTIGASVTTVILPIDPPTGSSIGVRSDSGVTLNPTIDAGTGRTIQDLGGNLDYNQTNTLGLKKRESFMYAYCADTLQWSAIARPASP